MSSLEQLAAAASRLSRLPSDLVAWLELAEAFSCAGHSEDAADAYAWLGAAASDVGRVALAVACARWLDQAKQSRRAAELTSSIATTHCQGSSSIDWSARPAPPPKTARRSMPPPPPKMSMDTAVKRARVALEVARKAASERAPVNIPPTPLVRAMAANDFRALVGVTMLVPRRAGDVVIRVGEPATSLYWIAHGGLTVSRDGKHLGDLRSGAFFGEIALVGGTTRTAEVVCSEETLLLEIPAESIEAAAQKAPKLAKVLAEYARVRLLSNVMRTSELFRRLSEEERKKLLPRFTPRLVQKGDVFIQEGAANDTLYVVVSGTCEVRGSSSELLATLGVGDGAGEMSLLSRAPAMATVAAVGPTVLLGLSRADFDDVAVEHPELLAEVYKLKLGRERANQYAIVHDAHDLIL